MSSVGQPLEAFRFQRLHRYAIEEPRAVRALLERLRRARVLLQNGMDHRNRTREARIEEIERDRLWLWGRNIDPDRQNELHLSFVLEGSSWFFSTSPRGGRSEADWLDVDIPEAIFRAERRSGVRCRAAASSGDPCRVEVCAPGGQRWLARVLDSSYDGLSLSLPRTAAEQLEGELEVVFLDGGDRAGTHAFGRVRYCTPHGAEDARVGLRLSQVPSRSQVHAERRGQILPGRAGTRAWRTLRLAGSKAGAVGRRMGFRSRAPGRIDVVEFENEQGQPLRGIVDGTGDPLGAPAVVIPPAWGRTKETLLPLAATLVRSFERVGRPLTVLRFDSTQQRGESYIDPECRNPGDEALHFTYMQVVRDLHAAFRFLSDSPRFRAPSIVLVTLSLASISGRRAVATDPTGLVDGWVSLVGMPDVQSALRTVSGGIDYMYGAARGVKFGVHELGGVRIDIDRAAADVLETRMSCLEDARRDMAAVKVPVTWIHGQHDGWMEPDRVADLVSAGDGGGRRFIEVPTGHQLRNSREALEVFQLVTDEVSQMLPGGRVEPSLPDLAWLETRQKAERRRAPRHTVDLREFWRGYLLGRDGSLGMELLTATNAYASFMDTQIDALALEEGDCVLDLGSGPGDFPIGLARRQGRPGNLRVTCVDLVPAALERGRRRLAALEPAALDGLHVESVAADLEPTGACRIPLGPGTYDAVLASLLVSYVEDPEGLLRAAWCMLRRGGRLVLSVPRRDADLSSVWVNVVMKELTPDVVAEKFGAETARRFDTIQRGYLNEAARLVTLEDTGRFRFLDAAELRSLVRQVGFTDIQSHDALGDPAQVVVVSATRP
ncbi:MAG: class I SAM-dependent methyltransferase [Myxococcota bacterium]|nr:class I SAM-dependent methyltransferase [Myxococcota bacterium]